ARPSPARGRSRSATSFKDFRCVLAGGGWPPPQPRPPRPPRGRPRRPNWVRSAPPPPAPPASPLFSPLFFPPRAPRPPPRPAPPPPAPPPPPHRPRLAKLPRPPAHVGVFPRPGPRAGHEGQQLPPAEGHAVRPQLPFQGFNEFLDTHGCVYEGWNGSGANG